MLTLVCSGDERDWPIEDLKTALLTENRVLEKSLIPPWRRLLYTGTDTSSGEGTSTSITVRAGDGPAGGNGVGVSIATGDGSGDGSNELDKSIGFASG